MEHVGYVKNTADLGSVRYKRWKVFVFLKNTSSNFQYILGSDF